MTSCASLYGPANVVEQGDFPTFPVRFFGGRQTSEKKNPPFTRLEIYVVSVRARFSKHEFTSAESQAKRLLGTEGLAVMRSSVI